MKQAIEIIKDVWGTILILVIIIGIITMAYLIITLPDAFADSDSRKKFRFSGTHDMTIYGDYKIDFRVSPRTTDPFTTDADIRIGNYKTNLFGGGMMNQFYLYNDQSCKRVEGFEYLMNLDGDGLRLDFKGKICYLGGQVKSLNLVFEGTQPEGIFKNATNISGTLTGSSNNYETNYNLHFNSILVYKND